MKEVSSELLSPVELLKSAKELFLSGKEEYFRPAVLEAISCLESYVQMAVFQELETKIDPLFLKWLQDKTRNDFDSRLSVLVPVSTGIRVDKASELWNRYKKAKSIRNRVTHAGIRITRKDAQFVINTVEDWLAYLASTITLQFRLQELCKQVESNFVTVTNKRTALDLLQVHLSYLGDLSQTDVANQGITDAIFTVGRYRIAVSVVFVELKTLKSLERIHADSSGLPDTFSHGVSLVFNSGNRIPQDLAMKTSDDGRAITFIINTQK